MRAADAATASPVALASDGESAAERVRVWLVALAVLTVFAALAWTVRQGDFYTPREGVGYWMGASGGTLMVLLLTYPMRKRLAFMQGWGALKHWFRMHMMAGVLGPLLVMFHSAFHVGSINAGIAMTCMLLVMSSGLVGRFLYRKIHHGLYGSRATLQELEQRLERDRHALGAALDAMPAVKQEVDRFAALVSRPPHGLVRRTAHFLSLGWQRGAARRRARRAAAAGVASGTRASLDALLHSIDVTLREAQRTAQFSTYERLFSIWHAVHIPFIGMLALTAVVHVVAVHFY
jgi:hypothetical protein